MSTKKPRKSLEDALASEFVYGSQKDQERSQPTQPVAEPPAELPSKEPQPKNKSLMDELQAPTKEPTTRFTADLPNSLHRKLAILAARTGRKKVEIVRFLLEEALKNVEE